MKNCKFLTGLALLVSAFFINAPIALAGHGKEGGETTRIMIGNPRILDFIIKEKLKNELMFVSEHLEKKFQNKDTKDIPAEIIDDLASLYDQGNMTSIGQDVANSVYRIQDEPCLDKNNVPKDATAGMFEMFGEICFSRSRLLAKDNFDISSLVGLAFHEHAHHFGLVDTDTNRNIHPIGSYVAQLHLSLSTFTGKDRNIDSILVVTTQPDQVKYTYSGPRFCSGKVIHSKLGEGLGVWPVQPRRPCDHFQGKRLQGNGAFLFFYYNDLLFISSSKQAEFRHLTVSSGEASGEKVGSVLIAKDQNKNDEIYMASISNLCNIMPDNLELVVEKIFPFYDRKCGIYINAEELTITLKMYNQYQIYKP